MRLNSHERHRKQTGYVGDTPARRSLSANKRLARQLGKFGDNQGNAIIAEVHIDTINEHCW